MIYYRQGNVHALALSNLCAENKSFKKHWNWKINKLNWKKVKCMLRCKLVGTLDWTSADLHFAWKSTIKNLHCLELLLQFSTCPVEFEMTTEVRH